MTTPKRVQRKRTKGWRMPDGARYVGRPSKWGNPFHVGGKAHVFMLGGWVQEDIPNAAVAVGMFEDWLSQKVNVRRDGDWYRNNMLVSLSAGELFGLDLVCWCPLEDRKSVV